MEMAIPPSTGHPPNPLSAVPPLALTVPLSSSILESTIQNPNSAQNPILSSCPNSDPQPSLIPTPSSISLVANAVPPHPSTHPPQPADRRSSGHQPIKSYAQATRSSRGPGFVRSHASDVESFARLPRTGVNIISGSRDGIPSFSFVNSDLPTVEELYSKALVMKFHGGRPSLEVSHREIMSWGIEKPFSIGPLSSRAFLLRFQDDKDLIRVLTRPSSTLITFPYKVFRWHSLCHMKEDSCFAPVWISLPRLPLQCFIPEFLEAVANKIGRFLCFDKATATLARPSAARLCVELDLRKPPPQFIWVGLFEGLKQPIIYERMPKFCNSCQAQGHVAMECPSGQRETLPSQSALHTSTNRGRPPHVRRNDYVTPTMVSHQQTSPNATSTHPSPSIHQEPLQPEHRSTSLAHASAPDLASHPTSIRSQPSPAPKPSHHHISSNKFAALSSLHHSAEANPSLAPDQQINPTTPHKPPLPHLPNLKSKQKHTEIPPSHTSVCTEKDDQVTLNSDESTSQSPGPPGFCNNSNLNEVNLCIEDNSSQSSGPPGFNIKIPKTKKKQQSKRGSVFSHRTHLKHFASSRRSSSTSKQDNYNPTTHLPINSLSSEELATIASNCGIKLPLSSADVARMKALEIERSRAAP